MFRTGDPGLGWPGPYINITRSFCKHVFFFFFFLGFRIIIYSTVPITYRTIIINNAVSRIRTAESNVGITNVAGPYDNSALLYERCGANTRVPRPRGRPKLISGIPIYLPGGGGVDSVLYWPAGIDNVAGLIRFFRN